MIAQRLQPVDDLLGDDLAAGGSHVRAVGRPDVDDLLPAFVMKAV